MTLLQLNAHSWVVKYSRHWMARCSFLYSGTSLQTQTINIRNSFPGSSFTLKFSKSQQFNGHSHPFPFNSNHSPFHLKMDILCKWKTSTFYNKFPNFGDKLDCLGFSVLTVFNGIFWHGLHSSGICSSTVLLLLSMVSS